MVKQMNKPPRPFGTPLLKKEGNLRVKKEGTIKTIFFALIIFLLPLNFAHAEYPERPINIYLPFASGGTTTRIMQEISGKMSLLLRQRVNVIPNDKKRTPTQAMREFVNLPNDGYNFIVGNLGTHGSAPALEGLDLRYDPVIDFSPVAMLGQTPLYISVRKDLPVRDFRELLIYMRAKQKSVTMAYSGTTSTSYLASIYFNSIVKTNPTMVPYSGSEPAMRDLAYGYIDIVIDQSAGALSYIQSGLVKAIAYTIGDDIDKASYKQLNLDKIPSTATVGFGEFNVTGWNILFAPRGTPARYIDQINKVLIASLNDPIIRANLQLKDIIIYPVELNSPALLDDFIHDEIERWKEIISINQ